MTLRIEPLRDLLVVRPLPHAPRSTVLSVVEPARTSSHAMVVACGPEVRDLAVGQRIVMSTLQGVSIDLGEPLILLRAGAVLGVVDRG